MVWPVWHMADLKSTSLFALRSWDASQVDVFDPLGESRLLATGCPRATAESIDVRPNEQVPTMAAVEEPELTD